MPPAIENLPDEDVFASWCADQIATILVPLPQLTLSEWADEYRVLSSEGSAEPGRWHTDRAPYLRGMMDAISDPTIEEVVAMKSAQVGYTEACIVNPVGFYIHQQPAPILVVQPNVDPMAKSWSTDRLAPMLRDTPVLAAKVNDSQRRNSENTILHKVFPGGHITVVGANAAAGLASRPIRVVLFDEVDRYPSSAGSEGDPIKLGEARTITFHNRKIVKGSTPTLAGASRIEKAFEESDQRYYHLPCPHCEFMQRLIWANMKFKDLPEPMYACAGCGALIPEIDKPDMLRAGKWVASKPGMPIAGFHISALYSPWMSWKKIVAAWDEAQRNPDLLQPFMNLILGEVWTEGNAVDASALKKRSVKYEAEIPAGVLVLTCGVDVQLNRIELVVRGWGAGEESWLIEHLRIMGDPTSAAIWETLDQALLRQYAHQDGGTMGIYATGVDTGYEAKTVYAWVRTRWNRRVFAMKGSSAAYAPLLPVKPARANKDKVRVVSVGTDAAKDFLYGCLRQKVEGPRYMHFPASATEEYFLQLTSERRTRHQTNGKWYSKYEVLPNRRNEVIDCEVYSLAAYQLVGGPLLSRKMAYTPPAAPEPVAVAVEGEAPPPAPRKAPPRPPRREGWVSGW